MNDGWGPQDLDGQPIAQPTAVILPFIPRPAPEPEGDDVLTEEEFAAKEWDRIITKLAPDIEKARDDLIHFIKLMNLDPEFPGDIHRSLYKPEPFHRSTAMALQQLEYGEFSNLIICVPPRHGKTMLLKNYIAWTEGRHPDGNSAYASYNGDYAMEVGSAIRDEILNNPLFGEVFPAFMLRKGAKSSRKMTSTMKGSLYFVGRKGALTGRGYDRVGVCDDLFKDAAEADSDIIREVAWKWFTKVFMTRRQNQSRTVLINTRWHSDDHIGRLTDPNNPAYDPEEAKRWKVILLPALAEVGDILGRTPHEALWPSRFSVEFLEQQKRLDPRGFSALYQQKPSPDDGTYFRRDWISLYNKDDRPDVSKMRIYAASDHAVGETLKHDATVMLIAGICPAKKLWLLDCWWDRKDTGVVVEAMLDMALRWKPIWWWAEKGHITKAIGPWLEKRKQERAIVLNIDYVVPAASKEQRARSAQGLMSTKRVMFPRAALWTNRAMHELLQFPHGNNDDFVDTISHLSAKVHAIIAKREAPPNTEAAEGTWGWWKQRFKQAEDRDRPSDGW